MIKKYLIFCFLSSFLSSQDLPDAKWKDINYGGNENIYNNMDIYLPNLNKTKYPLIITIYGSAWKSNKGKSSNYIKKNLIKPLLSSGFAVASINHRSSSDAIFPAQIHDVKAAIRFLRGNSSKYNINDNFIGITGSSSGGHLAALAGTSSNIDVLEGDIGNFLNFDSHVDAVVNWYGPTDFLIMDDCGSKLVHNNPNSPESLLIGKPIQEYPEEVMNANPIKYINKKSAPFLIIHGIMDLTVPHCQSQVLHDALKSKNIDTSLVLVEDGKHGPNVFTNKYINMMTSFFINQLSQKF